MGKDVVKPQKYQDPNEVLKKAKEAIETQTKLDELDPFANLKSADDMVQEKKVAEEIKEKKAKLLQNMTENMRKKIVEVIFSGDFLPESKPVQAARQALEKLVSNPDEEIRNNARWIYADKLTEYAVERTGNPSVPQLINELSKIGCLVAYPKAERPNKIKIGDRVVSRAGVHFDLRGSRYEPANVPSDKRNIAEQVFARLSELAKRHGEAVAEVMKDKKDEFFQDANRSWEEFVELAKAGEYVVWIPGYFNKKYGKWMTNGHIRVLSDGEVATLTMHGAYAPKSPGFRNKVNELKVDKRVAVRIADIPKGLVRLPEAASWLHRWLHNGYIAWKEKEAKRKAMEELKAKATISPEEFFQGEHGTAFIYTKLFMLGRNKFRYLCALVERSEAGIRVVETLEEFQGNPWTESCFQPTPEETNFNGLCANPATSVLAHFLRIAQKSLQNAVAQKEAGVSDEGDEPEAEEADGNADSENKE